MYSKDRTPRGIMLIEQRLPGASKFRRTAVSMSEYRENNLVEHSESDHFPFLDDPSQAVLVGEPKDGVHPGRGLRIIIPRLARTRVINFLEKDIVVTRYPGELSDPVRSTISLGYDSEGASWRINIIDDTVPQSASKG